MNSELPFAYNPVRHVLGPTERVHLPALLVALALAGCAPLPHVARARPELAARVDITLLEDRAESWRLAPAARELRGLRLLYDTPIPSRTSLAVTRWAVRSNHRLAPLDALVFAVRAVDLARAHRMDAGFFCSVLLQESAFSPDAVSPAGAVGIGQFTLDTAATEGIDPFDWQQAMAGSAALLGRYVNAYDGTYPDPYAAALAAYDAGPGTVAYYHGVPPYAETRGYIADVYDRWSRIIRDGEGVARARH